MKGLRVNLKKLSNLERLFWRTSIWVSCTNPLNAESEDFYISFNGGPCIMINEKTKTADAYTLEKMNREGNGVMSKYLFALDKLSKNGYDINFKDRLGPQDIPIVT